MRVLYPPVEPYATHRVDVRDGHRLFVEEVGRPDGIPAVYLHGGPGGGLTPSARQFFDPDRYRLVLIDQRGAGRSTPHGSVENNTTWHLVEDLERVRERLNIRSWLLFGGSWGTTLALAYAQAYPARATGLILRGLFLLRGSERRWFYQDGASHLQPEEWERFIAPVPVDERDDIVAAYHRRLFSDDRELATRYSNAWLRWEAVNSSLRPDPALIDTLIADDRGLAMSRILAHYVIHGGFFESEQQILDGIEGIRQIPAVLVQGRYDLCCPPVTAHDVASRWPEADVRIVADAGHSSLEPGITHELVTATDAFADRLQSASAI